MSDENEIIRLSCSVGATELCSKAQKEGTYKELFGGIPNLRLLPKLVCSECGGDIVLEMTGKYEITKPTRGFESNMAYPQYESQYGSHIIISTDGWVHLQAYVLKLKNEKCCMANAKVRKHWDSILAGIIPFGMRIAKEEEQCESNPEDTESTEG